MSKKGRKSESNSSTENDARAAVVATALAMSRRGLSPGRSGNVSCRWREGMLITPSGMSYEEITAEEIVWVGPKGATAKTGLKPSSEWRFHRAAYLARPEMNAVVHAHALHATVLACAHRAIPAFHYMVAAAGGADIPLVPYAPFGTEELARHVAAGLASRDACLMANHGMIAIGTTPALALELAAEVEVLAEQYVKVLTLGAPNLLTEAEMIDVVERFRSYGNTAQGNSGPVK